LWRIPGGIIVEAGMSHPGGTTAGLHCRANGLLGDAFMLRWTILLLVIALIAAVLGFGGIAGAAVGLAKIIFWVFLILFAISLIIGRRRVL
jgi:uncharacterized membrane protein YtjA (UPF0391 family)